MKSRPILICLIVLVLIFTANPAFGAAGDPDLSFGPPNGWVKTDFGSLEESGQAVATQSDGRIVVAGFTYNGSTYDFAVARYNADGSLDATFGTGGKVINDFGPGFDDFGKDFFIIQQDF